MSAPSGPAPRLLVIGGGAIGNGLLPRIARWPFARITIVDGDRVEEKNLERQELFAPVDIGRSKSAVIAAWFRHMPISAEVAYEDTFIDANNAEGLVAMHDIVADCTDDAHARRLIDRTCKAYGVALVSGAVHGTQGQVIVLHAAGSQADKGLDDLFPGVPGAEQDACDMRDVPMDTIEEVARRMAGHLRVLLDGTPVANGRIDQYDGRRWSTIEPPWR